MNRREVFKERLERHYDELKWLYCELYEGGIADFEALCENLEQRFVSRPAALKAMDEMREKNPDWYKGNDMVGMMLYTDAFAGSLKGVEERLPYLRNAVSTICI